MKLELKCYSLIRSCVNCAAGNLVTPGETVYVYTHPGQFTDIDYVGWVRATVLSAFEDCGCYNYVLELQESDLPANVSNLALCDIANIGCEPCANDLTVSGGISMNDQSGGTSEVQGLINFWSESLDINVTDFGRVQIEDLGSNVEYVDVVADLTTLVSADDGSYWQTGGYHAINDGGTNLYRYNAASAAVCDGLFILDGIGGSNSLGATQASYPGTGTGRFIAVDQSVANAKQAGAVGDGVADDTARLQAAILVASVKQPARSVFLSTGIYVVTSDLSIGSFVEMRGSGYNSHLKFNGAGLLVEGKTKWGIFNMRITRSGIAGPAIKVTSGGGEFSHHFRIDNVHVPASIGGTGLRLEDAFIGTITNLILRGSALGLDIGVGPDGVGANNITFLGGEIQGNDKAAEIRRARGLSFHGFAFEGCVTGLEFLDNLRGAVFTGCYFEANGNYHVKINGDAVSSGVSIKACYFYNVAPSSGVYYSEHAVILNRIKNVSIEETEFRQWAESGAVSAPVLVDETAPGDAVGRVARCRNWGAVTGEGPIVENNSTAFGERVKHVSGDGVVAPNGAVTNIANVAVEIPASIGSQTIAIMRFLSTTFSGNPYFILTFFEENGTQIGGSSLFNSPITASEAVQTATWNPRDLRAYAGQTVRAYIRRDAVNANDTLEGNITVMDASITTRHGYSQESGTVPV